MKRATTTSGWFNGNDNVGVALLAVNLNILHGSES